MQAAGPRRGRAPPGPPATGSSLLLAFLTGMLVLAGGRILLAPRSAEAPDSVLFRSPLISPGLPAHPSWGRCAGGTPAGGGEPRRSRAGELVLVTGGAGARGVGKRLGGCTAVGGPLLSSCCWRSSRRR